jgi:cytochrome b561
MTDENEQANEPAPPVEPEKPEEQTVILVSYPKIVFLYPTLIAAIVCGMYMWISGAVDGPEAPAAVAAVDGAEAGEAAAADDEVAANDDEAAADEVRPSSHTAHVMARFFLLVLTINLVVISFDFPRTTSLTLFFFVVSVGVIVWMIFRLNPDVLPGVTDWINSVTPFANATFYFLFSLVMIVMYIGVAISVRFDYWEVRPNELLHHHGVLSDLERFSAPNLRINKEINDVFEYALLRSGRLILHPSNERRAIVLENVFFINRKETQITRMLGALQVQVREQAS